jgi:hypothetical protein
MDVLLALTLIMVIFLAILALTMSKYANFWYKTFVAGPFDLINSIVSTEEVPDSWRIKPIETLANKNKTSALGRTLNWLLVKWYVFRLDRLVHTLRLSSLINKEDKLEYIEIFKEIRSRWCSGSDL